MHFKLKFMSSFYCSNTQSRKLSLLQAAPFPFPSHKRQCLNLHEDNMKLWGNPVVLAEQHRKHKSLSLQPWYYLDQKSEDADSYRRKNICQQNYVTQQSVTLVRIHQKAAAKQWDSRSWRKSYSPKAQKRTCPLTTQNCKEDISYFEWT